VTADAREHERAPRFGNRPFTMPDECAGKIAAKRGETRCEQARVPRCRCGFSVRLSGVWHDATKAIRGARPTHRACTGTWVRSEIASACRRIRWRERTR